MLSVKRLLSVITHTSFLAYSNQHLFGFEFTLNLLKINCLISLQVDYFFTMLSMWGLPNQISLAKCSTNRQLCVGRVGKSDKIVKFIVVLWSHHHYKQSKWQPLLGISMLYTFEVCLIIPFHRWKRSEPWSHVWFCDHTLITLTYDYWEC